MKTSEFDPSVFLNETLELKLWDIFCGRLGPPRSHPICLIPICHKEAIDNYITNLCTPMVVREPSRKSFMYKQFEIIFSYTDKIRFMWEMNDNESE